MARYSEPEAMDPPWRVLEFYSGIGGMRYSLMDAGIRGKVVEAFDINGRANDVYEYNFGHRPCQDFLDEQFTELQMLEDDSRGLLVEVISEFCDQPWLSQLSVLSSEPVVDFQEVAARVHKFKGTCSCVGAKRVALWCNWFSKVYEENDIVWYIPALLGIRREFDELHMRLKTILQLEQQIQALDAKAPSR